MTAKELKKENDQLSKQFNEMNIYLVKLEKDIVQLKKELNREQKINEKYAKQGLKLQKRVETLVEALQFYANEKDWFDGRLEFGDGETAREALKNEE